MISSLPGRCPLQMLQELDDLRAGIAPANSRKEKFHQVTPAIADKVFQLK